MSLAKTLGIARRDLRLYGAWVFGWLLGEVPGDQYLALRFLGNVVCLAVVAIYLHQAWRWVRANGAKRTAAVAAWWLPSIACCWIWFYGPGWWPVRVIAGVVFLAVAAFVSVLVRVVRERAS